MSGDNVSVYRTRLPKESGPTVVTKSPLLLMSQIFSNDSGALILMKYDNPA